MGDYQVPDPQGEHLALKMLSVVMGGWILWVIFDIVGSLLGWWR